LADLHQPTPYLTPRRLDRDGTSCDVGRIWDKLVAGQDARAFALGGAPIAKPVAGEGTDAGTERRGG
jgi:hypothetical protein